VNIVLNGSTTEIDGPLTVAALVAAQTGRERPLGVAVARNGAIVPRSRWDDEPVADGDEIELVGVMQGG
jgi:sulfur carrier protein